jgi:hypothetical protein
MGIILLILSLGCLSSATQEQFLLKINSFTMETFAVGKPQRNAYWDPRVMPSIRVCASTGISYSRISQAARYWEKAGYSFDGIRKDPLSTCMNARFGEIIITIPESGFADRHMASTRIYTRTKTGEIIKAKIQILPMNARKPRVLEHELGHALGWMHYRQKFHIMHPTWFLGGYDRNGLSK